MTKSKSYSIKDLDTEKAPKKAVTLSSFKNLTSNTLYSAPEVNMDHHSRLTVGMLACENFHIASSLHRRQKVGPVNSYAGFTEVSSFHKQSDYSLNSSKTSDSNNFAVLSNQFIQMTVENKYNMKNNQHPTLTSSVSAPLASQNGYKIESLVTDQSNQSSDLDSVYTKISDINSVPEIVSGEGHVNRGFVHESEVDTRQ